MQVILPVSVRCGEEIRGDGIVDDIVEGAEISIEQSDGGASSCVKFPDRAVFRGGEEDVGRGRMRRDSSDTTLESICQYLYRTKGTRQTS